MSYYDTCYENDYGYSYSGFSSRALYDSATAYDSFSGSMTDDLIESISIGIHDNISRAFSSCVGPFGSVR